jgi:hypothetical protein
MTQSPSSFPKAARYLSAAAAGLVTTAAATFAADDITVPSGLPLTLHEVITNQPGQGLTYRFRFISPDIARGQTDYETVEADMAHLCRTIALAHIPNTGPIPNRIVISIADRETTFGSPDPIVTQFFEAYSIEDDACIWEPF